MKIESIIKRPGGTSIPLGGQTYDFKPDATGRHVAEVADETHAKHLLGIAEGFRPADGAAAAPASGYEGDMDLDEAFEVLHRHYPHIPDLGLYLDAFPVPTLDAPVIEDADEPKTVGDAADEATKEPADEASLSDLRAEFDRVVGRKPSPRAGRDTMLAQIEAAKAEAAGQ